MTEALLRALLDGILARLATRLLTIRRVLPDQAHADETDTPSFAKAIAAEVFQARRQAWAASNALLVEEAKKHGRYSWVPPEPKYTPKAVEEAIRRLPGGRLHQGNMDRLQVVLDRHVEAAARQTIADAVHKAPTGVPLVDGALEHASEDLDGFPSRALKEIEDREEERARRERRARNRARLEKALDDIGDRAAQGAKSLQDVDGEPGARDARQALAEVSDRARRDNEGRLIARPFAFARVVHPSSGGPCGFCAMLASRGPVYKTSTSAGARVSAFHDHCRCTVVPVYTSREWDGKDEALRYARIYQQEVVDNGLRGAEARTAMDKALRGNRSAAKSVARQERNQA